jgi:hypothetical protein
MPWVRLTLEFHCPACGHHSGVFSDAPLFDIWCPSCDEPLRLVHDNCLHEITEHPRRPEPDQRYCALCRRYFVWRE